MYTHENEIPLHGGNVTGAVRIGDTVRRRVQAQSAAIHALLLHLERKGFTAAPRYLGMDRDGREILSFIAGDVGHYPVPYALWSDEVLVELAQMMRRYHDATTDFVPPADVRWLFVYSKRRSHEVICHNDIAPYNIIYVDNHPQAFIDFDCAGPGPRAWDMAYAAYRCVPLGHAREPELVSMGLADLAQQARRLNLFCSTYGIAAREVLKFVQPRLRALCTWLTEGHANGDPIRQRMVIEGHLLHYQLEIEQWQKSVGHLQQLLLGN